MRIGLFDEALVRNQDDELNLRLTRAGGKIWQSPAIISWYSPRPTLSGLFQQYFQYGFWKVAVIRKHRLPSSWRQLVPIAFVLLNILLLSSMLLTKTLGAAQWFTAVALLWLTMAAVYAFVTIIASVMAGRRHGWAILAYLPFVFTTYHLSYGLGFVAGLRWYFSSPAQALSGQSVFTRITR
jgi:succinoglycan biosynthesis protein ExoA